MLDKKVIEYAVKGIIAEIDEKEKAINQGKQFLKQIENGEKPKTPKSEYEIHVIIRKKKEEIEQLAKYKNELYFMLDDMQ